MTGRVLLPPLVALLLVLPAQGQSDSLSRAERLDDLESHVFPVRTVDPADDDFSDLQAWKEAIGDARIVILGEPSHGDGTVFRAKSRLVRFLHEDMNFSVLAFESGFYDLRLATENASTPDEHLRAATRTLSRPWAKSKQARPVLRYYAETQTTESPLHLAGIDGALRPPNDSIFIARLKRHVQDREEWMEVTEETNFEQTLRSQLTNPLSLARDTAAYRQFIARIDKVSQSLEDGSSRDEFWALMLDNVKAQVQTGFRRSYEPRNHQMARTLIWLAENTYANDKIIVWIATSHGIRNLSTIDPMEPEQSFEGQKSMGDVLADQFSGDVYTLGFTAHGGEVGAFYWRDQSPKSIEDPSKGSLEDLMGTLPHDTAILDLTGVPEESWLSRPQIARPLGYSEMRADWTQVMDGLMFIRTMRPNTKVDAPVDSSDP